MRARTVGHAQAGAQVVRVGHAIKHQQQGLLNAIGFEVFKQFVERGDLRHGLHARRDALVAMASGQLGNAHAVGLDQAGTGLAGTVEKLAHAGIAPRHLVINLDDGFRRGLQTHTHGVKAEENFGAGHGGIIRALPAPPELRPSGNGPHKCIERQRGCAKGLLSSA